MAETKIANSDQRPRLAVVVSHPIQYYTPYYRAIAADGRVAIKAFFCTRIAVDEVIDPRMGVKISWKTDLLSGYEHEFLPEAADIKTYKTFDVNNPSVTARLDEYKPDVVLIHGYAHVTLMRTMLWCRLNGVPLMNISDRSLLGLTTPLRKQLRKVVLPWILKQYTAFLVISDAVHEFYASFGARKEQIFRVPNMLDAGFWSCRDRQDVERQRVRTELGLSDEFVVLYVGKFIPLKRVHDLVAAAERLSKRSSTQRSIRFVFAGDGPQRKEIEREAKAKKLPIEFLGFVNIDKLPAYYCAADALAHPSENECFGIIALEAAVFGLPLVLSDRVGAIGPTSIARRDENTLVYPCADIDALAACLSKLADEPETCARMSEASLRFAQDHDGRMSVRNTLAAIDYCLRKRGQHRLDITAQIPA